MAEKTMSKRLVFSQAGHFVLIPYASGDKLDIKNAYNSKVGIVNSITRESSLNTADLPDGNSPYPAKTYVQTQSLTLSVQLSTYDPRLEALIAGATYKENEEVQNEMWYTGDLIVSENKNNEMSKVLPIENRAKFTSQQISVRPDGPAIKGDGSEIANFDYAAAYAALGIRLDLKTSTINTENLDLTKIAENAEVIHTIDGVKRAYMGIQFTAPDSAKKVKVSHTPDFDNVEIIDLSKDSQSVFNGQYISYIGFAAEVNGEWEKMRQRSVAFYFQWLDENNSVVKSTIKNINVQGSVSYSSILDPIPNNVEQMQVTDQYGNLFESVDSADVPVTKGHFFVDTDTGEIKFSPEDKDETLYLTYSYYGTNVVSVEYAESPKMRSFQAIIINETKDMNETSYQRMNTIIDKCSISGTITPPAQSNDPTGGWTLALSISKPRSGKSPVLLKFESVNEGNSELHALDEKMKKMKESIKELTA